MGRRAFAVGCWVLVALGIGHLAGHIGLMSSQGDGEVERQMLDLMRSHRTDMGLGFVRSMWDLLAGFSLTFSILPAGFGLLGLVILRYVDRAPGLLGQAAVVYAGVYGVMTAMALRYWFPAPIAFLGVASACFVVAVAGSRRAGHP
jgi:hypothetical protein